MPWTAPRTFVPGEIVDASMMNTGLRDQLTFAVPNTIPQDVPYSAANFSGFNLTWAVDPGDIEWHWTYRLANRMVYSLGVNASSISGVVPATGAHLRVAVLGASFLPIQSLCRASRGVVAGVNRELLVAVSGLTVTIQNLETDFVNNVNNTVVQFTLDIQAVP